MYCSVVYGTQNSKKAEVCKYSAWEFSYSVAVAL